MESRAKGSIAYRQSPLLKTRLLEAVFCASFSFEFSFEDKHGGSGHGDRSMVHRLSRLRDDLGAILDTESTARAMVTQSVSCACHTLQLVVRDGLKNLPASVSRELTKTAGFLASVKRSTEASG